MSDLYASPSILDALAHMVERDKSMFSGVDLARELDRSVFGIRFNETSAFPFVSPCTPCNGTGEGNTSTFCQKCDGAGAIKHEGMMQSGRQTILITGHLPRKFDPSFPSDIYVPPAPMRGLI